MKKLSLFLATAVIAIVFFTACNNSTQDLKLDKRVYAPGEIIKVEFKASPDWSEYAWIGIIPSNVAHGKESENDRYDIQYKYINKATSGTLEFTAPSEPG